MSNDHAEWNKRFLEAIVWLQAKNTTKATEYLQFVEQHRGREVAEKAKANLVMCAKHEAFRNAKEKFKKMHK